MKKFLLVLALFSLACVDSEARVGGGRSFGSRGSRGVSPRSAPMQRPSPGYGNRSNDFSHQAPPAYPNRSFGGGSFLRGMAGGLAGGLIGSMLFRNSGWAGQAGMGGGGSGFGLLEILLLAGVGYLVFRWLKNRRGTSFQDTAARYTAQTPVLESQPFAASASGDIEAVVGPDVERFKEARVDDFFTLQAALMNRELSNVKNRMTPEMVSVLESDIAQLKSKGQINRIENIAVRETEIIEAWQEENRDYATLRLKANLLDFMVDEKTGTLLNGSQTTPVKFDEYWTFTRDRGAFASTDPWKLSAIENNA